jgi:hypothetical protein
MGGWMSKIDLRDYRPRWFPLDIWNNTYGRIRDPMPDVAQYIDDRVATARVNSLTSFWPKDRKRWLEEYDRMLALKKSFDEGCARIRELEKALRDEQQGKARPLDGPLSADLSGKPVKGGRRK